MWDDIIRLALVKGGHMGVDVTLGCLKRRVYFPGLHAEILGYMAGCLACQAKRTGQPYQCHTLSSPLTGYLFQRIHLDFVGPFNLSQRSGATMARQLASSSALPSTMSLPTP